MTRNKLSIGRILGNNKAALVISFVLAVLIWIVVTMQFSVDQEVTIQDVPVTVDTTMSDNLELQMFGRTDFKVSVKVTGKRYEISSAVLNADSFLVTASTGNVSAMGKYTLPLNVRLKNSGSDVEIVSCSPGSIDVFFDYSTTKNFPVEVQIMPEETDIAENGYVCGDIIPSVASVTVSGAVSEMQKINKVIAKVTLDEPLTKTTKFENTPLAIVNSENGVIRSTYVRVEDGITDVTVTVPILKVMDLTPSVYFKNQPSYFVEHPLSLSWNPSGKMHAAVSTDLSESADSLALGTVDFSNIELGANSFTFNADDIPNMRILDDRIKQFTVWFTIDGFQTRTIQISGSSISFNNLPTNVSASIPEDTQLELTVIGKQAELDSLTPENIIATVDVSGVQPGDVAAILPVNCVVDNTTTCWVSGLHTVAVAVS